MSRADWQASVALPPPRALALWTDVRRWPTFVDGFGSVVQQRGDWPQEGSKLVWTSGPHGRGNVSEKVREYVPAGKLVVAVLEERLSGVQTVTFEPDGDGSLLTVVLEYKLGEDVRGGAITDWLFIRRALTAAIGRTVTRFGREAAEDAQLTA